MTLEELKEIIENQWKDILRATTLEEYGEATYQFYKPESVQLRIQRSVYDVEKLILDKLKKDSKANSIKINNLIEYTMFGEETFARQVLKTSLENHLEKSNHILLEDIKFKKDKDEVVITWKNK